MRYGNGNTVRWPMGSHGYGHMNTPHATWCGHRPSITFHSSHRLKLLTSLDYHVHSALAADIHSLALRTIFSQAVCSKAWKFLWWVGSYDKLDCWWKIRNPNHQQKIMKGNQDYGSYCKCIEINRTACSMCHAAMSYLGIFETENTAR